MQLHGSVPDANVHHHTCREGCANPFVMHLSLQAVSARMFVQASEARRYGMIGTMCIMSTSGSMAKRG